MRFKMSISYQEAQSYFQTSLICKDIMTSLESTAETDQNERSIYVNYMKKMVLFPSCLKFPCTNC